MEAREGEERSGWEGGGGRLDQGCRDGGDGGKKERRN